MNSFLRDTVLFLFSVTICSVAGADDGLKHFGKRSVSRFVFTESKCSESYCKFDDTLLWCNRESDRCECAELLRQDSFSKLWDIRSYYGNNNCSTGKFGPCGSRDGITIDCHDDGITCVSGTCLDANHLLSDVGESCPSQNFCKEGLLCSFDSVCIEPFTQSENGTCRVDNECEKGLHCEFKLLDVFIFGFCVKSAE